MRIFSCSLLLGVVSSSGCGNGQAERAASPPSAVVAVVPSAEPSGTVERPSPVSEAPPPAPSAIATSKAPPHEPRHEMVDVPAGWFVMGCRPSAPMGCDKDAQPAHPVWLDAYSIDKYEVTVADYRACLEAKACLPPPPLGPGRTGCDVWDAPGDKPMRCARSREGWSYCQWVRKRLPTEAEWERAARGTDERLFPWGNESPEGRVCAKKNGPCPVGSFPSGVSPVGAYDMAGNVSEWVADLYHPHYYRMSPPRNPKGYSGPPLTLDICNSPACGSKRGGDWTSDAAELTTTHRAQHGLINLSLRAGFRCAKSR